MIKNAIMFLLLSVITALGFGYYWYQTVPDISDLTDTQFMARIPSLPNLECQFDYSSLTSNSQSHVYISNGRMRADSVFLWDGRSITIHNVIDTDGYSYIWFDELPDRIKERPTDVDGPSSTEIVSCKRRWSIDPSIFTVPGKESFKEGPSLSDILN